MQTFIKALQTYFSAEPHGKKLEISELKELTNSDKTDLHEGLLALGIECEPPLNKA